MRRRSARNSRAAELRRGGIVRGGSYGARCAVYTGREADTTSMNLPPLINAPRLAERAFRSSRWISNTDCRFGCGKFLRGRRAHRGLLTLYSVGALRNARIPFTFITRLRHRKPATTPPAHAPFVTESYPEKPNSYNVNRISQN